jgi:hypothetical protein
MQANEAIEKNAQTEIVENMEPPAGIEPATC